MRLCWSILVAIGMAFLASDLEAKDVKKMTEKATFAGGCFWCMEKPFDKVKGVVKTTVGYTGGHLENPTYEDVSSGTSGHIESIEIEFDPGVISYKEILDVFWVNVDPFDGDGQFCDRGHQYTTAIFYHNATQKKAAEKSKTAVQKKFEDRIVTPIVKVKKFYPAEEYHQAYYQKNPVRYSFYRFNCGRDARLKKIWGDQAH